VVRCMGGATVLKVGVLAGQHGHTDYTVMQLVTNPYAYIYDVYRVTTCRSGWRHIVAAAHPQLVHFILKTISMC